MTATPELLAKLDANGQRHVLDFWDQLTAGEQRRLAAEINSIDLALVRRLFDQGGSHVDWESLAARAVAPPAFRLQGAANRFSPAVARREGREALRQGQLGVLLVAGGQGTRLGFDHPKGMFPIGPVSESSLFQIHIEKVVATAARYGVRVPLYLMTSPATHDETVEYLDRHDRFGLPAEDLVIFCQGTMPAVDAETGELLLAAKGELFLSPDGHGGSVAALAASGALADIQRRGLGHLFYFQVDDALTPVCDPEFIGYHLLCRSELSTLVVAKSAPRDRVGNVVSIDGQVQIIEYSDLPDSAAERRTADGELELWAGNTAVHVFDVDFLARMTTGDDHLPFHVARKAVPYIDREGRLVEPAEPNALKFERFIFDLLPAAERAIVVEADKPRAFAPLKNAPGAATATAEIVQNQMMSLHREWLEAAGAVVAKNVTVEISPRFALDAEQVAERVPRGTHVDSPQYFQ